MNTIEIGSEWVRSDDVPYWDNIRTVLAISSYQGDEYVTFGHEYLESGHYCADVYSVKSFLETHRPYYPYYQK